MKVTKAILTIQGFQETEGKRSGTSDLFWDVLRPFSSPAVTVYHPRSWKTNIEAVVHQIGNQGIRDAVVISYSHGQQAACEFIERCFSRNINVALWLACDPVYRPSWLPRVTGAQVLAARAMLRNQTIKVPRGVDRVHYVRQERNRPCGATLVSSCIRTRVHHPFVLDYEHTEIDSAPEWFDLVNEKLTEWVARP